jgi:hypothetical protein
LNHPQASELPQATVQLTPLFAVSFPTFAVRLAIVFTVSEEGGDTIETVMFVDGVIVIVAEADLLPSVTEVAVTITVFPLGTAAGDVYVVLAPLAVDALLNEPHAPLLAQVTVHFTPPFALSFPTFAVSCAWLPTVRVDGDDASETVIAGGVGFEPEPLHPPSSPTATVAAARHICQERVILSEVLSERSEPKGEVEESAV